LETTVSSSGDNNDDDDDDDDDHNLDCEGSDAKRVCSVVCDTKYHTSQIPRVQSYCERQATILRTRINEQPTSAIQNKSHLYDRSGDDHDQEHDCEDDSDAKRECLMLLCYESVPVLSFLHRMR
jgi:hypothetical protein